MTRNPELPTDDYERDVGTEYRITLPDGTETRTRDAETASQYSRAGARVTATTGWE